MTTTIQPSNTKKTTLGILRLACLAAASKAYACNPNHYEELAFFKRLPSPLYNHCAPVAFVVRAALGGDIVTGRIKGEPHYWNRLPDGSEVDLTSCQFGGDGMSPLKRGRKVRPRKLVPPRFLFFMMRVQETLGYELS